MGTTKPATFLLMRVIVCTLLLLFVASSLAGKFDKKKFCKIVGEVVADCMKGNKTDKKVQKKVNGILDKKCVGAVGAIAKVFSRRVLLRRRLGAVKAIKKKAVTAGCETTFNAVRDLINNKTGIPKEVINCAKPKFQKKCEG